MYEQDNDYSDTIYCGKCDSYADDSDNEDADDSDNEDACSEEWWVVYDDYYDSDCSDYYQKYLEDPIDIPSKDEM